MKKLLSILFLFYSIASFGQSVKQWVTLAEEAIANEEYAAAVDYYHEAYMLDSLTFEITTSYADALRLTRNYKKAEYLYDKAYAKDKGRLFPQGQYYLAQMQKLNGKYKPALRNFKNI